MFTNRQEAGRLLAEKLKGKFKGKVVVLGIPRGGMVVALEIAQELKAKLGAILTHKVSHPFQEELAIGAVSLGGEAYWNEKITHEFKEKEIKKLRNKEIKRLREKAKELGIAAGSNEKFSQKTVIIVDDGVATGATMIAALREAKKRGAKKIICATPVIAVDTLGKLQKEAGEVVYLDKPIDFAAVGQFFREFGQVEDGEVRDILAFSG